MKNKKEYERVAPAKWALLLCLMAVTFFLMQDYSVDVEGGDGLFADTSSHTAIRPNLVEVSHEFEITWGDSTDVEATLKLPVDFIPEYIDKVSWDTMACYTDGEILYIDPSTYSSGTIATDSRGTVTMYRVELKTNDGCEDGAVSTFILTHEYD